MQIRATIEERTSERRSSARRLVRLQSITTSCDTEAETSVEIHDLSATGFLMRADLPFSVGDKIDLEIGENVTHAEIMWLSEASIGCKFTKRLSNAQLSAAILRSQPIGASSSEENVVTALRRSSQRLAEVSGELDALERELAKQTNTTPQSSRISVDDPTDDLPAQDFNQERRFPLFVRGWTLLIFSFLFWTLLLVAFRVF